MGRMNWFDVLPPLIARQQIAWERTRLAARMRAVGFTLREVGVRFNVSPERARQLVIAGSRRRSPASQWLAGGSGFEFKAPFLGSGIVTLKKLADALARSSWAA